MRFLAGRRDIKEEIDTCSQQQVMEATQAWLIAMLPFHCYSLEGSCTLMHLMKNSDRGNKAGAKLALDGAGLETFTEEPAARGTRDVSDQI